MTTQRLYFSWTCLILQYSQAVLRNAHILCPILALILTNTYWGNAKLYNEGEYILSQEGTLLPWQCMLHCPLSASFRGTFPSPGNADDAAADGGLWSHHTWWHKLETAGPRYGYHPNPSKTWLVDKPEHHQAAVKEFQNTGINITDDRREYLGASVEARLPVEKLFKTKLLSEWNRWRTSPW